MKPYGRAQRVGGLIQQTLSEMLNKSIKDPRLRAVSITGVKMTADLKLAKIYFVTSGHFSSRQEALEGFAKARGHIRHTLAQELELRYMPELKFFYDDSIEYAAHINGVIKRLHDEMNRIIQQLKNSKRILLATHIHPDGDAIGSLLSMGLALEEIKKKLQLYNESILPAVYNFLPSIHRIKKDPGELEDYDTAVILDCSDLQRTGEMAEAISRIPVIINIDHHSTNSRFGNYQLIDPRAASTTVLIYRLITAMGIPVTTAMAYAIYTGIMADTGSFRFSNTNSEAFKICHEMVGHGVDAHKVAHHVYETISLNRVKLLNMLFDSIEISENGKLSIMTLTQNMLHATGTSIIDVDGLINYARRIENVRVAALLCERDGGRKLRPHNGSSFHVSLRSDGSVDVANLAAVFGGGGHRNAAGFDVQGSLPEVKKHLYSIANHLL